MAKQSPVYEQIGSNYAVTRRAEPRWEARIHAELERFATLVNVGAGSGSYEPEALDVVAVEPSAVMIAQRPTGCAPVVCAYAEQLPFRDGQFDVAMAILTTHHWHDPQAGLAELRRVARHQLVLTWDPAVFAQAFWLTRDYLPEVAAYEQSLATLTAVLEGLGSKVHVDPLPVPADCQDGLFGAFWARPEAYLSAQVRGAISGLALADEQLVAAAMARLQADLSSGDWQRSNARHLGLAELDLGYRIVKTW